MFVALARKSEGSSVERVKRQDPLHGNWLLWGVMAQSSSCPFVPVTSVRDPPVVVVVVVVVVAASRDRA